jgi:hypothetical protein
MKPEATNAPGHLTEPVGRATGMKHKFEYFQVEFEKEDPKETMKYIDSKRNWNTEKQEYRLTKEELNAANNANIEECKIHWRGEYLLLEHDGIVHYWDSFPYCFLKQAVEFFEPENPAKWKTLDKLIAFRMAIRQTEVNHCGYVETLLEGEKMTLKLYQKFMRFARAHDLQHNGNHTF